MSDNATKVPFADLHAQYLTIKQDIDAAIAGVIRESAFIRGARVDAFEKASSADIGTADEADPEVLLLRGPEKVCLGVESMIESAEDSNCQGVRIHMHPGEEPFKGRFFSDAQVVGGQDSAPHARPF